MLELYSKWMELKRQENAAKAARIEVEALIAEGIPEDWEGSKTWEDGPYRIKATRKFNRTVDAEKAMEISNTYGMEEQLKTLFRWKPEINSREWKKADETVTKLFSDAVTTTPGKVGFDISEKIEEVA